MNARVPSGWRNAAAHTRWDHRTAAVGSVGQQPAHGLGGPWGVSFAANPTPDATGLAKWTPETFIQAMRTGKHAGVGRAILPPMPWMYYARLTDEGLRAIFAYLQSLPPVSNVVPEPVPPTSPKPGAG